MNQPRGGERLAPEARDEGRVVGQMLGEQLHGDVALEPLVERQMHGRHPADAESSLDPVAAGDRRGASHCPFAFPFPAPAPPLLVPSPAPPVPLVLEEVPELVDVVADVVVVGVEVEVLVLVVVLGVLVVVSVVLLVELVLDWVVVWWQSRAASTATVLAPCLRLFTRVRLTDLGRPET